MSAPHDLLLFDLDGTISDPLVGIVRCFNYSLGHFGFPPLEDAEAAIHIGPPLDEGFRAITGVTSQAQIEEFVAKYRERYADVGYSENVLYPGVAEALAELSAAEIPLGICTSKRRDFAESILEMFRLREHFRFVSGGDVGVKKWQQIETLLSEGAISGSSVMIGDRAVDIVAAHRNGVPAAGVLWGHGSREELLQEKPRYLLDRPSDLPILCR